MDAWTCAATAAALSLSGEMDVEEEADEAYDALQWICTIMIESRKV